MARTLSTTKTAEFAFKNLAQRQVISVFREILSDPDFGLSLRPQAIKRLKKSLLSKQSGSYRELNELF